MASSKLPTYAFWALIILLVLIDLFLIWQISIESKKLKVCHTKQSVHCPVVSCNQKSTGPTSPGGKACQGFPWRLVDPAADPTLETSYECGAPPLTVAVNSK